MPRAPAMFPLVSDALAEAEVDEKAFVDAVMEATRADGRFSSLLEARRPGGGFQGCRQLRPLTAKLVGNHISARVILGKTPFACEPSGMIAILKHGLPETIRQGITDADLGRVLDNPLLKDRGYRIEDAVALRSGRVRLHIGLR